MRHEARQVPSWLIFDVGQKMKHIAIFTVLVSTLGCASSRSVRDEGAAVGLFRLREIGGTHDIELRSDHSGFISSYGAFQNPSPTPAKWAFADGVVTIVPLDAPTFSIVLSHCGSEVVMYSPSGRGPYVRVTEKTPNKAPEPTPGAVTPRATEGSSK